MTWQMTLHVCKHSNLLCSVIFMNFTIFSTMTSLCHHLSVVSTGNCKLGHDCRRVCSHRRRDSFVDSFVASAVCIGHKCANSSSSAGDTNGIHGVETLLQQSWNVGIGGVTWPGKKANSIKTSCGAKHNKPRPRVAHCGFSELTKNWITLSHGHSSPSLKISCKSVQPFACNVDKWCKRNLISTKWILNPQSGY